MILLRLLASRRATDQARAIELARLAQARRQPEEGGGVVVASESSAGVGEEPSLSPWANGATVVYQQSASRPSHRMGSIWTAEQWKLPKASSAWTTGVTYQGSTPGGARETLSGSTPSGARETL